MRGKWIAAAGLLLLAACGGGGGTGPSVLPSAAPVAQAVDARDGWTGAAVPGVSMTAVPGQAVTVAAAGYLPRVQSFAAGQPVFLWPQDETWVRAVVYGPIWPGERLYRWSRGFTLTVPAGFDDVAAEVATEASAATGITITPGPGGEVVATVDPEDSEWAALPPATNGFTAGLARGNTIVSARIVFRASANLRHLLLHEVGHALGLSHSARTDDVMFPVYGGLTAYSERERIALRMMYAHRSAGNAPPDRDGGAGAASGRLRSITIVD